MAFTDHAVRRYQERVRPALSLAEAEADLLRLAETHGGITDNPPEWRQDWWDQFSNTRWLIIGDHIALPITADGIATTCFARGDFSPERRERRNESRRGRRYRTKLDRKRGGGRRDDPPAEAA